jgi:hypothetical protein
MQIGKHRNSKRGVGKQKWSPEVADLCRPAPSAIYSHPLSPRRARQGWRFRLESTLYF